jgi:hypothetical protein
MEITSERETSSPENRRGTDRPHQANPLQETQGRTPQRLQDGQRHMENPRVRSRENTRYALKRVKLRPYTRDSSRIYAELKNAEDSDGKTRLRLQILLVGRCTPPPKVAGPPRGSRVPYSAMTPLTFTASLILTYFAKIPLYSFRMLRFGQCLDQCRCV